MIRFEKSLRKYHARVRIKDPQLGFLILPFWTVNINISLMNLILENSFFGVNQINFVWLIMI